MDQKILVPFRTTRMSAQTQWHLTGNSSAIGGAEANAWVRLQILDASGAPLSDSGRYSFGLFVDGRGLPLEQKAAVNKDYPLPVVSASVSSPSRNALTQLTLRAILECEAKTRLGPGEATVAVVRGEEASRLLKFVVEFYR